MKSTASLINVGRGALVDEDALTAALDSGRLHSAGLDTVCVEPLPQESWLLHHDRVVLTPHDAGVSDQVFDKLTSMVREALERHAKGEPLDFLLN
jgi:phosphoglycerate dehydrogenase-like enzyme